MLCVRAALATKQCHLKSTYAVNVLLYFLSKLNTRNKETSLFVCFNA